MSQQSVNLVHDDVLAKMDALLKKHHDALARGSVPEDFPVLTEVVKEAVDVIPVLTEVVETESDHMPAADFVTGGDGSTSDHDVVQDQFPPPGPPSPLPSPPPLAGEGVFALHSAKEFPQPDEEALPVSGEALDRRILEMLEQRLPAHIVAAVDKALPVVLEEFAMELESMVRDAVAQEIRRQLMELLPQGRHGDVPE